ncbi:mitochondrial carrier [Pluteus cervinus]|uniref:Mitochondrial carrier n=1 Tax=Pluteus cervinus TaxID=181527 RepID=A0ACD3B2P6_9AGAR|nr:mitochondrial carrier [Pluteus cervinus]
MSATFKYPFDLAKVRLQSQLLSSADGAVRFKGPVDCLVRTYKHEGVRGLYRGLPVPMVGSMMEAATLFLTYSTFQNVVRRYNGYSDGAELSISQHSLAAACAGFVTSFAVTPIDLVKCKMQVQMMHTHLNPTHIPSSSTTPRPQSQFPFQLGTSKSPHPQAVATSTMIRTVSGQSPVASASLHAPRPIGPIELVRNIIHTRGLRGLWVGQSGMLLLETIGAGSWFTMKELVAGFLRRRRDRVEQEAGLYDILDPSTTAKGKQRALLPWESAVAGATAGATCVLALYPIDTVKSAMQTEEDVTRKVGSGKVQTSSFLKVLKRVYAVHGVRGLYSGCGMTVARVVPSSGIVFMVYDVSSRWIG